MNPQRQHQPPPRRERSEERLIGRLLWPEFYNRAPDGRMLGRPVNSSSTQAATERRRPDGEPSMRGLRPVHAHGAHKPRRERRPRLRPI